MMMDPEFKAWQQMKRNQTLKEKGPEYSEIWTDLCSATFDSRQDFEQHLNALSQKYVEKKSSPLRKSTIPREPPRDYSLPPMYSRPEYNFTPSKFRGELNSRPRSQERRSWTARKYEDFAPPYPTYQETHFNYPKPTPFPSNNYGRTYRSGFNPLYEEREEESYYEPLVELSQMRPKGREKGEGYFRAMQELGGIEDTIAGMEESLMRNELRAIESKQRMCGCVPYSSFKSCEGFSQRPNRFANFPSHPENGYYPNLMANMQRNYY